MTSRAEARDDPRGIRAIDAVANIRTAEALAGRPDRSAFYEGKIGVDRETFGGISLEETIRRKDEAGIERAFLVAAKVGVQGHPACYHLPYRLVAEAVQRFPDRFRGIAGLDPTEGMAGLRALERAVRDDGFIGAHLYPHGYALPPDHAKWHPFHAECADLGIPVQLRVGQPLVCDASHPRRSVGRPIALDAVACDFPDLKILGIPIGIRNGTPWHDEMIAMAWKRRNAFIVADAHSPRCRPPGFVRHIQSCGQDKVLFGRDFPVPGFQRTRREVEAPGLRPGPLRRVLRDNALRVYGLG